MVQLWKQKEAIVKESKGENGKERVLGNPSEHDFTVDIILRSDSGLRSGLFYVSGTCAKMYGMSVCVIDVMNSVGKANLKLTQQATSY